MSLVLKAEVAHQRASSLGEGSLWDVASQRLYWVDIIEHKVMCFDPSTGANPGYDVAQEVGTVVLTEDSKLLLGLRSGISVFDPHSGSFLPLCSPEPGAQHKRLNDGKCDRRGRFWVGSMVEGGEKGSGGLFCLDADLHLERKLGGVSCSNGLVWSKDSTKFYYIDTPTHRVDVFDHDAATGAIENRRTVARFIEGEGAPDGMTIDADDCLWVALWGGSKVVKLDPNTGEVLLEVAVPATNVTSCAFGGPDLSELYITTARVGESPQALAARPLAGSLFRASVSAVGVPSTRFARSFT